MNLKIATQFGDNFYHIRTSIKWHALMVENVVSFLALLAYQNFPFSVRDGHCILGKYGIETQFVFNFCVFVCNKFCFVREIRTRQRLLLR